MDSLYQKYGYIYLIQDGYDLGTDVFKIGKTAQNGGTVTLSRMRNYNKGTIQVYLRIVSGKYVDNIERDIIKTFKTKYTLAKGNEWFNGSHKLMIKDIDSVIDNYVDKDDYIELSYTTEQKKIFDNDDPDNIRSCPDIINPISYSELLEALKTDSTLLKRHIDSIVRIYNRVKNKEIKFELFSGRISVALYFIYKTYYSHKYIVEGHIGKGFLPVILGIDIKNYDKDLYVKNIIKESPTPILPFLDEVISQVNASSESVNINITDKQKDRIIKYIGKTYYCCG